MHKHVYMHSWSLAIDSNFQAKIPSHLEEI